jgi:hypothetical protein
VKNIRRRQKKEFVLGRLLMKLSPFWCGGV